MSDVNVSPTPIQRNSADVAVELTREYLNRSATVIDSVDDIASIYTKLYSVAEYCRIENRVLAREVMDTVKTYLK